MSTNSYIVPGFYTQTIIRPAFVTVVAVGGKGGDAKTGLGGYGGIVAASYETSTDIYIVVGGKGGVATTDPSLSSGGYNGGGSGSSDGYSTQGGGGGGASVVFTLDASGGVPLTGIYVVAAGGGGGYYSNPQGRGGMGLGGNGSVDNEGTINGPKLSPGTEGSPNGLGGGGGYHTPGRGGGRGVQFGGNGGTTGASGSGGTTMGKGTNNGGVPLIVCSKLIGGGGGALTQIGGGEGGGGGGSGYTGGGGGCYAGGGGGSSYTNSQINIVIEPYNAYYQNNLISAPPSWTGDGFVLLYVVYPPSGIHLKTIFTYELTLQEWLQYTEEEKQALALTLATAAGVEVSNLTVAKVGGGLVTVLISGYKTHEEANAACSSISGLPSFYSCEVVTPKKSDICFPAGTPIKTDQGEIEIEKLVKDVNTIKGKYIKHITETLSIDNYLICFEKDALWKNYPSKRTIMSKEHKIEYKGKMVEAYRLENASELVKKVKYSGEVLYNVLLEEYGVMEVNNLVCETLDPLNRIACEYNKKEYKATNKGNNLFKRELTKRI